MKLLLLPLYWILGMLMYVWVWVKEKLLKI